MLLQEFDILVDLLPQFLAAFLATAPFKEEFGDLLSKFVAQLRGHPIFHLDQLEHWVRLVFHRILFDRLHGQCKPLR